MEGKKKSIIALRTYSWHQNSLIRNFKKCPKFTNNRFFLLQKKKKKDYEIY